MFAAAVALAAAVTVVFSDQPGITLLLVLLAVIGAFALNNPAVALAAFAATIPLESALSIPGIGTVSRIAGAVLLGSAVLYWGRRRAVVPPSRIPLVAWGFLLYAFASLTWAREPQFSDFLTLLQLVVAAWLAADIVATQRRAVAVVLAAYCAAASLTATLAILQYTQTWALGSQDSMRASAFDEQSVAHFSAEMIPAFLYAVSRILQWPGWRSALPFAFVSTITLSGILISGTRSAWVAVLIGLTVLLVRQSRPLQVLRLLPLGLVAVVFLSSIPQIADFIGQRTALAVPTGGAGRLPIWQVGLSMAAEHAPFGAGFGSFSSQFDRAAIESTWGLSTTPLEGRGAHNIYLALLADLGVIGFMLWTAWTGGLLVGLIRHQSDASVVIAAILVALLAQGLFLDNLNRKYLFLALGLAEGLRASITKRFLRERRPNG